DVRNVAIGADQDPKPLRCQNLSGMSTAHMIEEPAVVFQAAVGHSIAWMQVSERTAVGKGTCAVVQRQLIGRVAALDRSRLVQTFAQTEHGGGDGEALGLVCVEERIGAT